MQFKFNKWQFIVQKTGGYCSVLVTKLHFNLQIKPQFSILHGQHKHVFNIDNCAT